MGIVADRAGLLLDRVSAVRLLERAGSGLVAGDTEVRWRHREEILFGRGVRKMALHAPLLFQSLVRDLLLETRLIVALEADCIPFGTQEVRRIRCMWIVARNASVPLESGMHRRTIQPQILDRVAFMTDLVSLFLEEELRHDPVPKVAILTFPILHDLVHVLHREILLDEFLMTVQALLSLEFPLFRIRRIRGEEKRDAAAEYGQPEERCVLLARYGQHRRAQCRMFFADDPSPQIT
jgi:hypothetical protein